MRNMKNENGDLLNLDGLLQYSNIFPVLEKMMSPICAPHSTESSSAFLNRPVWRLEKVTCLVVWFSILSIAFFPRPIIALQPKKRSQKEKEKRKKKKKGIIPYFPAQILWFICVTENLMINSRSKKRA